MEDLTHLLLALCAILQTKRLRLSKRASDFSALWILTLSLTVLAGARHSTGSLETALQLALPEMQHKSETNCSIPSIPVEISSRSESIPGRCWRWPYGQCSHGGETGRIWKTCTANI